MTRLKLHLYLIACIAILVSVKFSSAQETPNINGIWEGKFMGDYKAVIELANETGKIQMFAGEQQIQNDELTEIKIAGLSISFLIPAKETTFEGTFQEGNTCLSGEFIFPDGSRHPIALNRISKEAPKIISWEELKSKTYAKAELEQDFQYLLNQLQAHHPQLNKYIFKQEFNQMVHDTRSSFSSEMTLSEFFSTIAPVVDAIKCSHTGIRLPGDFREMMQENVNSIPLELVFINDQIFIKSVPDNLNSYLQKGDEIVSINTIPSKELITQMEVFIPREGNNETTKLNELNRHFRQYLPLVIDTDNYEIEYLDGSSKNKLVLEGMSNDIPENPNASSIINFHFNQNNSIGNLKISSFTFEDINRFIHLTDSIFRTLQSENTQHLILDLRDNAGGHPIFAAQVLSYLTNRPFTYFKENPEVPDFEPLYHSMKPNPIQFGGQLYVLVNGGCLSTTGHLISLLKYHTNAIYIGEQPGSMYTCNDGSKRFIFPNTGIEANIPSTTFETAVEGFERKKTFMLDYEVNLTIEDLLTQKDPYLELSINFIEQNN